MKLTKTQLKQIIKEEFEEVFLEEGWKDIALAGLMGASSLASPQATAAQPPVATQVQTADPAASGESQSSSTPDSWKGKTSKDERKLRKLVREKAWYTNDPASASVKTFTENPDGTGMQIAYMKVASVGKSGFSGAYLNLYKSADEWRPFESIHVTEDKK